MSAPAFIELNAAPDGLNEGLEMKDELDTTEPDSVSNPRTFFPKSWIWTILEAK